MRVKIDADLCTGCELCVEACPDVFEMNGDVVKIKVDDIPADAEDCTRQAADECPVEAIEIEE